MSIDVIIPAYKPDEKIYKLFEMLSNQTVPVRNIKVYLTVEDSEEYKSFKASVPEGVIVEEVLKRDFTHGGTRQRGADESDADYLLFMTQDAVPANDNLVEALLAALALEESAIAYARQVPYLDAEDVERFSRLYNYPPKSHTRTARDIKKFGIKSIFCSNSCAMYRHSVFKELGGFDVNTDFNEDMIMAFHTLKAGYSVEYCAKAIVFHSHKFSYKQLYKRNYALAKSQKEHPEVFGGMICESEGFKYLFTGLRHFFMKHKYKAMFQLIISCIYRYAGFFKGKHHKE